MSSTVTRSSPWSATSCSAAECSAVRVASFLRSRSPVVTADTLPNVAFSARFTPDSAGGRLDVPATFDDQERLLKDTEFAEIMHAQCDQILTPSRLQGADLVFPAQAAGGVVAGCPQGRDRIQAERDHHRQLSRDEAMRVDTGIGAEGHRNATVHGVGEDHALRL